MKLDTEKNRKLARKALQYLPFVAVVGLAIYHYGPFGERPPSVPSVPSRRTSDWKKGKRGFRLSGRELSVVNVPSGMSPSSKKKDPRDSNAIVRAIKERSQKYFIAADKAGFVIFDIKDPKKPQPIGYLDTPGQATDLLVRGDQVFLADNHRGVHLIDASDLKNPKIVSSLDTPARSVRLASHGEYIISAEVTGARILRVDKNDKKDNVAELKLVKSIKHKAYDVEMKGNLAFVAAGDKGVVVWNLKDPTRPKVVATIPTEYKATELAVEGNRLAVGCYKLYYVIDITNLNQPEQLASQYIRYRHHHRKKGEVARLDFQGGHLVVSTGYWGAYIIDLAPNGKPTIIRREKDRRTSIYAAHIDVDRKLMVSGGLWFLIVAKI